MAPSLEIDGLHLSYGGFMALKEISLKVARGEFVALLGPSGCGKTSLLRAIAGFVHPQQGSVRLNGHDVAKLLPRQRNIGLVFQSYALFPHMSVIDNVRFGLECRNVPKAASIERAQAAMALVGLETFADRMPKQLSGGQQQRVALARALVIEPDLLLLDEPLGALDKRLRVQMQTELKALQRRLGVTAVFVTHDQEEAMSMADRIVVMAKGIGNGFPLGAVVAQRQVADSLQGKFLFHTYGASPMACAAGRAVLQVIDDEGLQDNAKVVGNALHQMLERLQARHEIIGEVRGRGLMQAIELVSNRQTKAPATQETAEIFERTREHGLVVSKSGASKNILRMVPPMCLQLDDIPAVEQAMERCFEGY
ncbi:MAG: aminotransferase class III-fold pyridoxal phosphate-dependent enzyme [Betaproteobacteria bacterium]|nr:aminotransferase class III-fold pyridoxal phosphate-dependent enzyme [Betaproteobacteria bacterium]